MKELWNKYTRTSTQRAWVGSILLFLFVMLLFAIFMPFLFQAVLVILLVFVPPILVVMFIQRWVNNGERY